MHPSAAKASKHARMAMASPVARIDASATRCGSAVRSTRWFPTSTACRGTSSASAPRYEASIRFACDCTVSSSHIRFPSPESLITYSERRSALPLFTCGPGYVGGWTTAVLPSTGSSAWWYVSATRSSSPINSLMDTGMSCLLIESGFTGEP